MAVLWTFRVAGRRDVRTIAEMSREIVEVGLRGWRFHPRAVGQHARNPDTEVMVAERDGEIVGFAILQLGWDDAHLVLLGVKPSMRRQGLGASMVRWLEELARTAGIQEVHLEVRAPNVSARRFYRSLGYNEGELLPGYYEGQEDAVRMSRRLAPR